MRKKSKLIKNPSKFFGQISKNMLTIGRLKISKAKELKPTYSRMGKIGGTFKLFRKCNMGTSKKFDNT